MLDILKEITNQLPKGKVSAAAFEGANIVLYTKDEEYVFSGTSEVKAIVNKLKKRIELRPDPSISMDMEKAEKTIKKLIGKDAGIGDIMFDPQRSCVVIQAEKPGVAIGKAGEKLQEIKKKTLWVPTIHRTPAIKSKIVENIRSVLYENSDFRRNFLHKTGQRIYNGWLRQKKEEWIRITYLGAGREVGKSAILLQTPESRILLDCGINVADNKAPYPYLEAPEFKIEELDAVIVSHAHLDHVGFIPYLFKFGYRGPVYCTAPTRDIMCLSQLDLVKIQINEGKDPIYTSEEVKEMVKHTITLNYEEVTDITPDVRITLYNAGHMLGGSMIHLHIGNGLHNMLYTGDIKFGKSHSLSQAANTFPRLETLMIESTYGGKESVLPPFKEQDEKLKSIIEETVKRKGKVLCPVLGSGRAQEVLVIIQNMIKEKRIPELPIYIDGMVWDMTAIYTAYPEFLSNSMRSRIFHKNDNPFLYPNIKHIGSRKEREQLIESTDSCIILATSGMLVGGPSVEYLKKIGDDPKHTLVFSCYQGPGSLGRRIQQGEKSFSYREKTTTVTVELKLQIEKFIVTGHSDRRELMNFISRCSPKPRRVIVNHGEPRQAADFASSIRRTFNIEVNLPRNLDALRLK
jgi:uncharacterized protein